MRCVNNVTTKASAQTKQQANTTHRSKLTGAANPPSQPPTIIKKIISGISAIEEQTYCCPQPSRSKHSPQFVVQQWRAVCQSSQTKLPRLTLWCQKSSKIHKLLGLTPKEMSTENKKGVVIVPLTLLTAPFSTQLI
jgi:hypothetical protein